MSIIAWVLLGLISGFVASRLVDRTSQGFVVDFALGVVGALIGGFIFDAVSQPGVTGFNVWSLFVAAAGAAITLAVYHAVAGRIRA